MEEHLRVSIDGYNPTGDVIVMALCMILLLLMWQGHKRKKNFTIAILILIGSFVAAVANVCFQMSLYSDNINITPVYAFRTINGILQALVTMMYIQYLHEPLWIGDRTKKKLAVVSLTALAAAIAGDTFGTIYHYGFFVCDKNEIHSGLNAFVILYAILYVSIFYMIIKYRSRLIRQIFFGLLGVQTVSVIVLLIQGIHGHTAYTSVALFFPVLGMIFLFHSNPFDVETGSVNGTYLEEGIDQCIEKKQEMLIMCCKMMDFSRAMKNSSDLRLEFYTFFRQNIRKGILYHFDDERFVFTVIKRKGTDYSKVIRNMLDDFDVSYQRYRIDYKIVTVETIPEFTKGSEYISLIKYIEDSIPYNTVHKVTPDDVKKFYSDNYMISQLEDIVLRKDLNDSRVLVYCQPVYSIEGSQYDTAEALMRLQLDKTGIVFPDRFIPLAEQGNFIYMLSKIILNKTCRLIKQLSEQNYKITRISVNFSTLDLRNPHFCDDVCQIIEANGIPYSKVAVEITESRSESDFNLLKDKVQQLQKLGIKFYLDDFGTGYSNFERIMEIPFDIIKFDRSMLIESVRNSNSHYMVRTFSGMFSELNYAVLFEGVENDHDEMWCRDMNARYLQGYKYSKPIPAEKLTDFLEKENT